MPLSLFSKSRGEAEAGRALYEAAVEQARQPVFYARLGVPDSLDGRFDMVALHVFLLLHRLKTEGPPGARLAQSLFDTMFQDMDQSLREMGVGDLGVGRRVKAMATGLYGRIAAYEAGLAGDDRVLAAALERNLFGTMPAGRGALASICAYMRQAAAALAARPLGDLQTGRVGFGFPPVSEASLEKQTVSD
ncbi:MAG TPA: ubiquinol-cytochrome C chaperone family protein [Alphaproteobacteria bacterium]|nr:ubiquinol-cytochrome C chaperone family protein [Alphaproteobacteria bacterium]